MLKKLLLSFVSLSISSQIFAQEDVYDNTILCLNLNPYLKDTYIKFNNSESKAWVMDLENYTDDTWSEKKLSSQPDRWVIDMSVDGIPEFKLEIILKKKRNKPISIQVFKMTSFENDGPNVASNQLVCMEDEDRNIKTYLEDKDLREKLKTIISEKFTDKKSE